MKKNHELLAVFCLVMTIVCGCSNSSNNSRGDKNVIGVDGKEYDSYQSACRHQDFVAAYDWIEKNNGNDDDKDYVFNAEMLYLTSLGTEEAANRIVYLLAEYQIPGTPIQFRREYYNGKQRDDAEKYFVGLAKFNQRCDNVIDMAIAQGNKSLAKKIVGFYKQEFTLNPDAYNRWVTAWDPNWTSKERAIAKINEAFGEKEEAEEEEVKSTPKGTKKKRR